MFVCVGVTPCVKTPNKYTILLILGHLGHFKWDTTFVSLPLCTPIIALNWSNENRAEKYAFKYKSFKPFTQKNIEK